MSVPLDRLYYFLQDVCNHDVIIYRFYPHGSKNWAHCHALDQNTDWVAAMTHPHAVYHDQEPVTANTIPQTCATYLVNDQRYNVQQPYPWFKSKTLVPYQLFNQVILVHSERNSADIDQLSKNGYIPVHYFCHALIARDWFRYAEHDLALQTNHSSYKFLVYNRAWSGTREYRLKFAELLVKHNLVDSCLTSMGFEDCGSHYSKHIFKNPSLQTNLEFENYFTKNAHSSDASADYNNKDYQQCDIEIVLETLFDDQRQYLTEKSLRPVAVGKPFVLASTPHSLEYLKSYGFETFDPWINEEYDSIVDPVLRLQAITDEMQRLKNLGPAQYQSVLENCNRIAARNKQRFFSREFFEDVVQEYKSNMAAAVAKCRADLGWGNYRIWAEQQPQRPETEQIAKILRLV